MSCVCKLFESMGLLCCHCLEVLKQESVVLLEDKFIVDRWRKDLKRANMTIAGFTDPDSSERYLNTIYIYINTYFIYFLLFS